MTIPSSAPPEGQDSQNYKPSNDYPFADATLLDSSPGKYNTTASANYTSGFADATVLDSSPGQYSTTTSTNNVSGFATALDTSATAMSTSNNDPSHQLGAQGGSSGWLKKSKKRIFYAIMFILISIGLIITAIRAIGVITDESESGDSDYSFAVSVNGNMPFDESGWAVDLSDDGRILAVGAVADHENAGSRIGSVSVYSLVLRGSGLAYTLLGNTIQGEPGVGETFGGSVSLSSDGQTVAIGDHLSDGGGVKDAGRVNVYSLNETTWKQVGQSLDGTNTSDWSGRSVALSDNGDMVAIGTIELDSGTGFARVYKWNETSWIQLGSALRGEEGLGLSFGFSLDLSGDGTTLVVGDYRNGGNGETAGSVRVYQWNAETDEWEQQGQDLDGAAARDWFGWSTSISKDGSIVAVGAVGTFEMEGGTKGYVRIYKWTETGWQMIAPEIRAPSATSAAFGMSVDLSSDGSRLVVGDHRESTGSASNIGSTRVYILADDQFKLYLEVSGANRGDFFGRAVAFADDGRSFAAGAPGNDDNGLGSGQVTVYFLEQDD